MLNRWPRRPGRCLTVQRGVPSGGTIIPHELAGVTNCASKVGIGAFWKFHNTRSATLALRPKLLISATLQLRRDGYSTDQYSGDSPKADWRTGTCRSYLAVTSWIAVTSHGSAAGLMWTVSISDGRSTSIQRPAGSIFAL